MKFEIKKIGEKDLSGLLKLLKEFAEFENLENELLVTEEKLDTVLFGEKSFVKCLVGLADSEIVAYAIFFPVFKSFRGDKSMYLEDLYVSDKMRGKGLGLQMLKAVAKFAKENGFVRMDWQALNWNTPAINFYKNLGAESNAEQIDFRLIGKAFDDLAS